MVSSSERMRDLILGAVDSREAFQKALSQNSTPLSTEARCADRSEQGPGSIMKQGASSVGGEQGGSRESLPIDEKHSDPSPCDPSILERLGHMLCELMQKPTDEDLIALAKAQIRNEWYTKDGSTFWYRDMETGLPDFEVPLVNVSFILLAAELALRDLFHRRSLFDTMLLPQLEQVMKNEKVEERDKVGQMVFLRHHSPVGLRPKVGRLRDDVPFADSFVFHWELFRAEKSDGLLDGVLKSLKISPTPDDIPL